MNERELVNVLHQAADSLGLNLWAVARRLEEPERDVAPAFEGGQGFTVELLVRVAQTLGLEVDLRAASPNLRQVGPVPSVVDQVIQRLTPHLVAQQSSAELAPGPVSTAVGQRAEVDPSGEAR